MMRTSRIAKETSKSTQAIPPTKRSTRLQARNFAQALSAYAADGSSTIKTEEKDEKTKQDITSGGDTSDLSTADSTYSADIEDLSVPLMGLRKRKRGVDTPSMITSNIPTSNVRTSPHKTGSRSDVQSNNTSRKAKKQPVKKVIKENGEVEIHPPPNWEEIYEAVKEMRKKVLAPVDTMGCETLAQEHSSPRVRAQIQGLPT